jgi:hypothetical protein
MINFAGGSSIIHSFQKPSGGTVPAVGNLSFARSDAALQDIRAKDHSPDKY